MCSAGEIQFEKPGCMTNEETWAWLKKAIWEKIHITCYTCQDVPCLALSSLSDLQGIRSTELI